MGYVSILIAEFVLSYEVFTLMPRSVLYGMKDEQPYFELYIISCSRVAGGSAQLLVARRATKPHCSADDG